MDQNQPRRVNTTTLYHTASELSLSSSTTTDSTKISCSSTRTILVIDDAALVKRRIDEFDAYNYVVHTCRDSWRLELALLVIQIPL